MTLLLSAPPYPPSLPSHFTLDAELAQMRHTLKNKLLVWDWVDSDGWPVLKGTVNKAVVGSAYYFSGYKALMFSLIWYFQKGLATRMWASSHGLTSSSPQAESSFVNLSWDLDLPRFQKTLIEFFSKLAQTTSYWCVKDKVQALTVRLNTGQAQDRCP